MGVGGGGVDVTRADVYCTGLYICTVNCAW